jgi:pimeloyl-ACP methyl ester carboxylesterase
MNTKTMLLATGAMAGCGLFDMRPMGPTVLELGSCQCLVVVPFGARIARDSSGNVVSVSGTEWAAGLTVWPYATLEPMSVYSRSFSLLPANDAELVGVPVESTMSGFTVLTMDSIYSEGAVLSEESLRRRRVVMVDDGCHLVMFEANAVASRWVAVEGEIESAIRTFSITPTEGGCAYAGEPRYMQKDSLMLQARAQHPFGGGPSTTRQPLGQPPADSGWRIVEYQSEPSALSAYLYEPQRTVNDGNPAVIWIEGGFGGPSSAVFTGAPVSDHQTSKDFADAGFVVLAPAFRGEADNAGNFEMFYGETEDLLVAVDFVKALDSVDASQVYIVGHSTGGTHALLAAVTGVDVAAVVSIGGRASITEVAARGGYGVEPFALDDLTATQLRSAAHWTGQLRSPVWYFEGENEYFLDAVAMARASEGMMHAYPVPFSGHFDSLHPVKALVIRGIQGAASGGPPLHITERDLFDGVRGDHPLPVVESERDVP